MSASGTLFLQTSVFPFETRIFRARQESQDLPTHGRRRKSSAPGPYETLSATVAGARSSTEKLATRRRVDCTQVSSCNAGEHNPPRRAVRNKPTHAKTCQLIHKTPNHRETIVAAAHAEGKTAAQITQTRNASRPKAANQAVVDAPVAAKAPASPSNVLCRSRSSLPGGRSS